MLFLFGIFLVAAALGICLWLKMPFCVIGLTIALAALVFNEYRHQQFLRTQMAMVARENASLRAAAMEKERYLTQLRQLTEDVETALVVATPAGHVEWSNQMARLMLGEDLDLLPDEIMKAIHDNRDEVNGMALSASLIRIDGHRRFVLALKDIHLQTERHKMEAWQQLIRVLTHEIRNSITPIITICQQVQHPASPMKTEDIAVGMSVVERRCKTLMDFMESYSQLTRLKMPDKKPFPVRQLFSDMEAMYPICQCRTEPDDLILNADRTQLEQVLINMIQNAEEAGATLIQLEATANEITVTDNGHGISAQIMKNIFTPFFTTKKQGSGIGLNLCRQVVLLHGGRLTVESTEEQGTCFHLYLT